MAEQGLATKQDVKEIKGEIVHQVEGVKKEFTHQLTEFKDEIVHHFRVVAEGLEHRIELVAEYTQAINNKLDRHIAENKKEHEQLGNKITQLGMDLSEHRDNTELHGIKRKRRK